MAVGDNRRPDWGKMSHINNPEQALPYFLRGAFREFETAMSRYLVDFNLPLSQFYILRLEWSEDGNTQIDIAKRAFMTESVASQVLKKMEARDLVRRKADPNDRRSRLVHLTSTGKDLRSRIVKDGIRIASENGPKFSAEDIQTTVKVLVSLKRALEDYNIAQY